MGGDSRFWFFFGGIWLIVGISFVALSLGINLLSGASLPPQGPPLWVFTLVGLAASAAGGSIIYWARRSAARDRRLRKQGWETTGTVLEIRRSALLINRQTRWHVIYRYQDSNGRELRSESRALPGERVANFKPGDPVRIKVDSHQPEATLFIGAA